MTLNSFCRRSAYVYTLIFKQPREIDMMGDGSLPSRRPMRSPPDLVGRVPSHMAATARAGEGRLDQAVGRNKRSALRRRISNTLVEIGDRDVARLSHQSGAMRCAYCALRPWVNRPGVFLKPFFSWSARV